MIGKNEQTYNTDSNLYRIKLIADKKKILEHKTIEIQEEIKHCFTQLTEALKFREKQLLRQAEAIHTQQLSLIQSSLEFLPSMIVNLEEQEYLKEQIRNFGNIELSATNSITVKDREPYKVAEYEEADKDHINFNKSIKSIEKQDILNAIKNIDTDQLNVSADPISILQVSTHILNSDSLNSSIENDRDLQTLSNSSNESDRTKDFNILPFCNLSYTTERDISLTYLELEKAHNLEKCSSNDAETSDIDSSIKEISEDIDVRMRLEDKFSNTYNTDLCESNDTQNNISEDTNMDCIKGQDTLKDVCEHPKQVQQWLQQILVETEIEPMIHEIEQFSELSEVQHYNKFQLQT